MARSWNKVFGIGLSKTGTTSLAEALRILGLRVRDYPHDARTQEQLASGDYQLDILRNHDAITDTPAAFCFEQLDATYPGSLFILSERADRAKWLESFRLQWEYGDRWSVHHPQFRRFNNFIHLATYGVTEFHADRLAYVYERHAREVRRHFADRPDDLLHFDVTAGDSWPELCRFLVLPVPSVPYPRANTKADKVWTSELMQRLPHIFEVVAAKVPEDEAMALVDDDHLSGSDLYDLRKCVPLVQREGVSYGAPADSKHAIKCTAEHLASARRHLLVLYPSFWWFDTYADWKAYVEAEYEPVHLDETCRIYRATKSLAGKA